jgi:hypothetical protein
MCIVPWSFFRKQLPCHHFGEALYIPHLQTLECMTFLHQAVECCIVHQHRGRKPQQCHHFGEALNDIGLLKSSEFGIGIDPN